MINQKDGMVVFLDSPEKYASPETLSILEQQMATCTKLHQYIQEMDEQIQVNPQVIFYLLTKLWVPTFLISLYCYFF